MEIKYDQQNSGLEDSFQAGLEFQDFVCTKLLEELGIPLVQYSSKKYQYKIGESYQGVEIKLDNRCTETHQLSIEIAEKRNSDNQNFIPSGIYRKDNSWLYIQGNYKILFIFQKNLLQMLHAGRKYKEHEMPTIRKFYLPFQDAEKYCAKKIVCDVEVLTQ